MTLSWLNFGMLAAMAAVVIPILVHLLNRRRFDVVEWGAMQFLKLGERTRQKIKLSDLLLLLLRMGLVAILVAAFARPFLQGSVLLRSLYPEPIDLVLVLDSSYSMGFTAEEITPHARAIEHCHDIIDTLTSVDRVAIIDARGRPRLITPAPLTDTATARLELEKIQRPDGTADLAEAIRLGCELLTQCYSTRRDIVVLTDRQSHSWASLADDSWNEFLRLKQAAAVPIRLSAIDVGSQQMDSFENFFVNQLEASQGVAVVDSPISVSTRVGYNGSNSETECELYWSIDGQQLSRETDILKLQPGETAVAELTTRFADPGEHVITATLKDDSLPGDNVSTMVVNVRKVIPVKIIAAPRDDVPADNPRANYYLSRVFGNADLDDVLIQPKLIDPADLDEQKIEEADVLFLLNPDFDEMQYRILTDFMQQGGAVVVMADRYYDQQQADKLESLWRLDNQSLIPARFRSRQSNQDSPIPIDMDSFMGNALSRYQGDDQSDLQDVLVSAHWQFELLQSTLTKKNEGSEGNVSLADSSLPRELARLENGDLLFTSRRIGRGELIFSAISLDGYDSDLVRQRSFVPLMHDLVIGISNSNADKNIEIGQPLLVQQLPCHPLELEVQAPDDLNLSATRISRGDRVIWKLDQTWLSGVYHVQVDCATPVVAEASSERLYSAFAARDESKMQRLTAEQQQDYQQALGLSWRNNSNEVLLDLSTASGGLEIWPLLLLIVTIFLVLELLMTRRLVQGGHHQVELQPSNS